MATLTAAQRRRMAKSQFAVPSKAPHSGSYPMPDRRHAMAALSRVSQHGTDEDKARVRAMARRRFGMCKTK